MSANKRDNQLGYKLHMRKKKTDFNVKQQSNVFDLIHTSYFILLLVLFKLFERFLFH